MKTINVVDRFLRYAKLDTQSDPASAAVPSTEGQLAMLRLLGEELRALGATEIELLHDAYLVATIPETAPETIPATIPATIPVTDAGTAADSALGRSVGFGTAPVIGFLAHVDTSPDAPGANVNPCVSGDYITAGEPCAVGEPTLLGADDKAGVAAIMTAAEILLAPDAPPHGRLRIAFTTDEEVGRGTQLFDTQHFNAAFAYTVDGGAIGELQFENFNAAAARIVIRGVSAHPGDARGKMASALRIAMAIDAQLPADERAETTCGRDGFYHLVSLAGTVELADSQYIIRDFDAENFEARKRFLAEIVERANASLPAGASIELRIEDQYKNMYEVLRRRPEAIERAREAMLRVGVKPVETPIRGGTDGARLTEIGLPCPNIFTGGENFHSTAERLHIPTIEKCVEVLVAIASGCGHSEPGYAE